MGLIYQYDKRYDVTYVYEQVQKYSPDKGTYVKARKIVGRLDKKENKIVPTRKRAKSTESPHPENEDSSSDLKTANIRLLEAERQIQQLTDRVDSLCRRQDKLISLLMSGIEVLQEM